MREIREIEYGWPHNLMVFEFVLLSICDRWISQSSEEEDALLRRQLDSGL